MKPIFANVLVTLRESTSDTEYSLIEDSDNEADTKSIEDTSDVCRVDPPTPSSNENNTSSLSLVADYGTDSDKGTWNGKIGCAVLTDFRSKCSVDPEERINSLLTDNGPEEIPFKKIKVDVDSLESEPAAVTNQADCGNPNINNSNRTRSQNNNGRNKGKDSNRVKRNDDDSKDEQRGQRFQKKSNDNHNARGRANNGKKIQLLNKLLSKSIQHERNLISQCIKYIVDNNYFEWCEKALTKYVFRRNDYNQTFRVIRNKFIRLPLSLLRVYNKVYTYYRESLIEFIMSVSTCTCEVHTDP